MTKPELVQENEFLETQNQDLKDQLLILQAELGVAKQTCSLLEAQMGPEGDTVTKLLIQNKSLKRQLDHNRHDMTTRFLNEIRDFHRKIGELEQNMQLSSEDYQVLEDFQL